MMVTVAAVDAAMALPDVDTEPRPVAVTFTPAMPVAHVPAMPLSLVPPAMTLHVHVLDLAVCRRIQAGADTRRGLSTRYCHRKEEQASRSDYGVSQGHEVVSLVWLLHSP